MSRYRRWNELLELLAAEGQLQVERAAQVLGVSAATVRRDFDELARQQMLTRIRGGAGECGQRGPFGAFPLSVEVTERVDVDLVDHRLNRHPVFVGVVHEHAGNHTDQGRGTGDDVPPSRRLNEETA